MTTRRHVRSAIIILALSIFPVLPGSASLAGAQSGTPPTLATDITAAEIAAVAKTAEGTDREIKIVDQASGGRGPSLGTTGT